MKSAYYNIRKYLLREDAATTVEFVVLFPIVLLVFFIAAENVVVNLKTTILDRALDLTVRELRLGLIESPTQTSIKTLVCQRMGSPAGCSSDLVLEMTVGSFSSSGNVVLPSPTTACNNNSVSINPVVAFISGGSNDLVFVRACYTVDVTMPMTVGPVSASDAMGTEHRLISTAVFMNEPN
jgi:Flp pilus assembly protein TadG